MFEKNSYRGFALIRSRIHVH